MFKYSLVALFTLVYSFAAQADFEYTGKGTLTYPTGITKAFDFGFAFKEGPNGYFFKVGKQEMPTTEVPKRYSIWLTLHKEKHLWVQEFAKGYFQAFDWKLGDHTIKLYKKTYKNKAVKGDYLLEIDGDRFNFHKANAQIQINFTKKGILSIETDGFIRDSSKD